MRFTLHFLGTLLIIGIAFTISGNKSETATPNSAKSLIGGVDEQDSLALVALYNASGEDNLCISNWLSGEVSTWSGVTVRDCRVVELILSNCRNPPFNASQMISVPSEIGNLDSLTYLDLSSNSIADFPLHFPSSIGDLKKLTYLDFSGNQLSVLPSTIGGLINLTHLDLSGNRLDELPLEIENLNKLTYLNLDYNRLTELPTTIGNLEKLNSIMLRGNCMTELPTSIGNLEKLTCLDLSGNCLTHLPSTIGNIDNLVYLLLSPDVHFVDFDIAYLEFNQLTELPPEIGNLQSLEVLHLEGNKLTKLPSEIGNLHKLTELTVGNLVDIDFFGEQIIQNQLTELPSEIGNLQNLKKLQLRNNQLTTLPPEIGNLNLSELDLKGNQLTELPSEIGNIENLRDLDLRNNQLTFQEIEKITINDNLSILLSPQAKVGVMKTDTVETGITQILKAAIVGGEETQYQWHKDGILLEEETDSILIIENLNFENTGTYTYQASNNIVTNLVLESEPQYLVLPAVTKTINQDGSGDYNSIQAAIDDLVAGNIDSIDNSNQTPIDDKSIIFDIVSDSILYNEQIIIPEIEGTSPTFSVNINGNGNILSFDDTSCEDQPAVLQIDGGDYVVIANLNIEVSESENATGGWGIHLKNAADNVQITNCQINAKSTATAPCFAGIVASKSDTTYLNNDFALSTLALANANHTIIKDCIIEGGYAAIAIIGSQDTTMFGPTIVDNIIKDAYSIGILNTFSYGAVVENNQIDMTNYDVNGDIVDGDNKATNIVFKCDVGKMPIDLFQKNTIDLDEAKLGRPVHIQNNHLFGVQYRGIEIIHSYRVGILPPDDAQPPLVLIANNRIEGTFNDKNPISAGIYLDKSKEINCYHNSIEVNGAGNQLETALFIKDSGKLAVLNNSLAYNGENGYSMYVEDNSGIGWDYNNYYKGNSSTLAHYNGTDFFTLEEIPGNSNSISTEPTFVFTFNDDSELLDTASIGVASLVPFDFEGDVRPDPITLKPDIGANEFVIGVFDNLFDSIVNAPVIEYNTPNQWQHVFKNDSIAVSIHSTVDLGEVGTDLYLHNQETLRQANETFYLDRNFRLEAENGFAATETVQIRLYVTQRELDRLMEVDEQIHSFKDLHLTYLDKELEGGMDTFSVDEGNTIFFAQENSQQISTDAYLLEYRLTGVTQLGEFWLHGGEEALVVSIEEAVATFEGLSIYPNPFDNQLVLELDSSVSSAQTDVDVVVMDVQGRVVFRTAFEAVLGRKGYVLDFPSELGSGVYFVEVRQGEKRRVLKVVGMR